MKKLRFISIILLGIFSVLLIHNSIPHPHVEELKSHCSSEHDVNHTHDRDGHHCHAFNALTFNKTNHSSTPELTFSTLFGVLLPGDFALRCENPVQTLNTDDGPVKLNPVLAGPDPLRGPPVVTV